MQGLLTCLSRACGLCLTGTHLWTNAPNKQYARSVTCANTYLFLLDFQFLSAACAYCCYLPLGTIGRMATAKDQFMEFFTGLEESPALRLFARKGRVGRLCAIPFFFPNNSNIIFNAQDTYYTAHADQALWVADEFFKTRDVVTYVPPQPTEPPPRFLPMPTTTLRVAFHFLSAMNAAVPPHLFALPLVPVFQ